MAKAVSDGDERQVRPERFRQAQELRDAHVPMLMYPKTVFLCRDE